MNTEFVVTEQGDLLEILLQKLSNQSRNNVKSLLVHGQVLVDGKVVTQYNHPLRKGQTVRIARSVDRCHTDPLDILYEDHELIVINKPAGLLTIATNEEKEKTAYHFVTDYVRRRSPKARIFIVHRLDRDTSGVILFAKNEKFKLALQENWSGLVQARGYLAVVEGHLNEKTGTVHSWLKETKTLLMYSSHKAGDGLEAITNYSVLREAKDYSLLQIALETGRKNQIRVHMKDLGHPIAGDPKYGATSNPLKRLGLHAYLLEFTHPNTRKSMRFETDLPKEFKKLFK